VGEDCRTYTIASLSRWLGRTFGEFVRLHNPLGGEGAGVAALGSAVFMMLLLDVWRKLKLLPDDSTEHLQRSLTIFWAKDLPEAM